MNHIDVALSRLAEGFNCSQAVFSSYADGIDEETALKIASGFGGGMGRMAGTCGAVTGAFMVLGLRFGGITPDQEAKERIYEEVREFANRFKARNGSLLRRDLLNLRREAPPKDTKPLRESGLFATSCPKYLRDAAEILEEMLAG